MESGTFSRFRDFEDTHIVSLDSLDHSLARRASRVTTDATMSSAAAAASPSKAAASAQQQDDDSLPEPDYDYLDLSFVSMDDDYDEDDELKKTKKGKKMPFPQYICGTLIVRIVAARDLEV